MKHVRSISLLLVTTLAGCGEPSYEQCIRDAVKDGKSEFGIRVLYNLCDEEFGTEVAVEGTEISTEAADAAVEGAEIAQ